MVRSYIAITDRCPDGSQYVSRLREFPTIRAPDTRDWMESLKIYLALKEGETIANLIVG